MSASAIIADVRQLLDGRAVYLAGSVVAEETYGLSDAHSDVDIFCPTETMFVSTGQFLLDEGFTLDDRMAKAWDRWMRWGFNSWHTNSLRLVSPAGIDYNLVYKLMGKKPVNSLAQVIESFDFGLLATGYDLESNQYRDMRSYLFPDMDKRGALPLMPNKREQWRKGLISQYNGLRECGRYAKYHTYGYDMSAVKDDLTTGYFEAAMYFSTHFDAEKQQLGKIYDAIGNHIQFDNIDQLIEAYKLLDFKDSLDEIMEALE